MPWEGVTVMDQRVRFISEYLDGYFPVAEICRQFYNGGISNPSDTGASESMGEEFF